VPKFPGQTKRPIATTVADMLMHADVILAGDDSARIPDANGWWEIKGNPIAKVGVMPYSAAQVQADGWEADPMRIIRVLQPPEELADPECIQSFRLVPWVDEHANLGPTEQGLTPAEKKGIQGVVGEEVFFDGEYLRGNVKVFSETLREMIDSGKKELSIGYRAQFEFSPGVYNGQPYDAIKRHIRGNHLALVGEGRCGPDVAVFDHMTTNVTGADKMADGKEEGGGSGALTLEGVAKTLAEIMPAIAAINAHLAKIGGAAEPDGDETVVDDAAKVVDPAAEAKPAAPVQVGDSAEFKALAAKVDALTKGGSKALMVELTKRDKLAGRLSEVVGVFDHAEMTLTEVAKYGAAKLSIPCGDGAEVPAVEAYLLGLGARQTRNVAVGDSAEAPKINALSAYLSAGKGE